MTHTRGVDGVSVLLSSSLVALLAPQLMSLWLLVAPAAAQVDLRTDHFEVVARDRATAERAGRELERAAKVFTELWGVEPPFGRVTLLRRGLPGTGVAQRWTPGPPDPEKGQPVYTLDWVDPPKHAKPTDPDLMTHEVGHFMFNHWMSARVSAAARARADRYGSPLPDWWDEAIAVYVEPDHMRRVRREQVRMRLRKLIPLKKLFAMEHPLAEELNRPGGAQPADYRRKQELLTLFYGQTYAVLDCLVREGGVDLARAVNDGLAAGQPMDEILKGARGPRALRTVRGLQRVFGKHVATRYSLPGRR